jgi:hypothetical protein
MITLTVADTVLAAFICSHPIRVYVVNKRTYGSGSFRRVAEGKYELRYRGQAKWVGAATDRQANNALHEWVKEREKETEHGPAVSVGTLLDMHISDLKRSQ